MSQIVKQATVLLTAFMVVSIHCFGQVVAGNGYLIGSSVEIAIDGNGGHEGTADWPGHHSRGGSDDVPFGFVADQEFADWLDYDGDFFTPGTPENGFGIEVNGVNYSNNGWNSITNTPFLSEIPTAPGSVISHSIDGDCITVEWEGLIAGVTVNIKYHLIVNDLFYTTEVTLTNGTASNLTDVYYYRNVDPDNNEALTGNFATTNTIVSQPDPDCIKALVSAEQATPWTSYLGIGALGNQFRVTHGGFSNRSGSDIWNGAGALNSTLGDVDTDDEAISLAYKTDIAAGETISFTYAVVLSEEAVEDAFSSLYFITYENSGEVGGGIVSACNPATVVINSCRGNTVTLSVNGPSVDQYEWTWYPIGLTGESIDVTPSDPTTYSVIGIPISECLVGTIIKNVSVKFTEGPQIVITDPGPICGEFDITTLVYTDTHEGENTTCIFLSEEPDSATQTMPEFVGPMMGPDDNVWLMCGDSVTGCFDYIELNLNFIGPNAAGEDSTTVLCGGPGMVVNLTTMLSDSANIYGYYEELIFTGNLNDSTGVFNASNLYGTYEFMYIIEGFDPCEDDTAFLTIELIRPPSAEFIYGVDGQLSSDGYVSTCIVNEIQFIDSSTIDPPDIITDWYWDFGDGDTSILENPTHTYSIEGVYTVTLVVTSSNGCIGTYGLQIQVYETPTIDLVYNEPTCFGDEDAVIVVDTDVGIEAFTVEIKDESGTVLNDGPYTASGLGIGTYIISIEDASGCGSTDTLILEQPPELEIFSRVFNPPCLGDSGYVVIDSVAGQSLNNPISFAWEPNPAGIGGIGADSSYWMVAGTYSVTVMDAKGCTNEMDFTLVDPPLFYFTEWGSDTAYCRQHAFQSGNGIVYAAAAGGIPNYTYNWTYLVDGTPGYTPTWGGRNPGDHLIKITDAGGCVLTKIIHVDSVNPIASFTTHSAQLNDSCQGTAEVQVQFTNTSTYYANPNNPNADTTFFWDMDRTVIDDWIISHDINEQFDTLYGLRGASYDVDVCLIAFNKNGCRDTACKTITIFEPPEIDVANIFSPNNDGVNDYFTFEYYSKGIKEFTFIIVNRWGIQVAEVDGISPGWDGRDMDGQMCTDGVYFYTFSAEADNGETFSGYGNVTLVNGRP